MASQAEITYYENIGVEGLNHAINKPFSDERRAGLLMEAGAILGLLPPPPAIVLECGCGTGWFTYFLAKSGYEAVGADVALGGIEAARKNPLFASSKPAKFVVADFENLSFDQEFDAIVFFSALHHATDPERVLRSCYQALKPGGILIASEPGLGHEKVSEHAIAAFGVTDKAMPPYRVKRWGLNAGFRKTRTYQHADQIAAALYAAPSSTVKRKLFKVPGVRYLALNFSLLFYKQCNGITWLQK